MAANSRGFIQKLIAGLNRSVRGNSETEDMFLSMIQVALEDERIAEQILNLLEKDSNERRVHLQVWADELTRNGTQRVKGIFIKRRVGNIKIRDFWIEKFD